MSHFTPETLPARLPKRLARSLAAALNTLDRQAREWTLLGSRCDASLARCRRLLAAAPPLLGSAEAGRCHAGADLLGEAAEQCDRNAGLLVRMRRELLDAISDLDPADGAPEPADADAAAALLAEFVAAAAAGDLFAPPTLSLPEVPACH